MEKHNMRKRKKKKKDSDSNLFLKGFSCYSSLLFNFTTVENDVHFINRILLTAIQKSPLKDATQKSGSYCGRKKLK